VGDLGRHIFQRVRARERAGDLGGQPREEARGDEDAGEQAEGLVPACRLQVWWGFVWVCWCVDGLVGIGWKWGPQWEQDDDGRTGTSRRPSPSP